MQEDYHIPKEKAFSLGLARAANKKQDNTEQALEQATAQIRLLQQQLAQLTTDVQPAIEAEKKRVLDCNESINLYIKVKLRHRPGARALIDEVYPDFQKFALKYYCLVGDRFVAGIVIGALGRADHSDALYYYKDKEIVPDDEINYAAVSQYIEQNGLGYTPDTTFYNSPGGSPLGSPVGVSVGSPLGSPLGSTVSRKK